MEQVNKAGKAKKLRGFEMIKSVWLDEEPWSGAHGCCTLRTLIELPSCTFLCLTSAKTPLLAPHDACNHPIQQRLNGLSTH